MITRQVAGNLLCFRQLDHALLARRLAERWGGERPTLRPRAAVLHAIGHHDAGWPDLDRRPVWNPANGAPHTFRTHDLLEQLGVADRSTARVAEHDPYSGWLVGRHFLSFHDPGESSDERRWAGRQRRNLARLLVDARDRHRPVDLEPAVLQANFDWLQLFDALSLALCHDWTQWVGRPMAVAYDGSTIRYRYARRESTLYGVVGYLDPWVFDADSVAEAVTARLLEGCRWADEPSLLAGWEAGRDVEVAVLLSPR